MRVLERFELVVQIADAAAAGDGLVEHRAALHLLHVLAEVADGQLLRNRDVALVGVFLADDHAEERGLAGAVGADQADLLAGVQLKGGVDEDQLLAVLLVDIGKGDQKTKLAERGRFRPLGSEVRSRMRGANHSLRSRLSRASGETAPWVGQVCDLQFPGIHKGRSQSRAPRSEP